MDTAIVNSINAVVGATDYLFHLGDFCFGDKKYYTEFRSRINCQNIFLVYGNHDERIIAEEDLQSLFSGTGFYREVTFNSQKIVMSHYAMRVWNQSHKGSWMLHGHSHGTLEPMVSGRVIQNMVSKKKYNDLLQLADGTHAENCANGKTMDVGIDTRADLRPYSFDEIKTIMDSQHIAIVDSHAK